MLLWVMGVGFQNTCSFKEVKYFQGYYNTLFRRISPLTDEHSIVVMTVGSKSRWYPRLYSMGSQFSISILLNLCSEPVHSVPRASVLPWNIDLTPLENLTHPLQKRKDSFFKETKDFISNIKWEQIWMSKHEYTVAKSKNQMRARLLVSISFLLSGYWQT